MKAPGYELVTLNQLRAFLAAADLGSFTAAANHLDVSQASVSDLVKRLEEELKAPLFVRGPRQLILSAAGDELRPYAERSVAAAQHGTEAVSAMLSLRGGRATFGSLRNANYYQLSDLVREFHKLHPNVHVRLVGQNSVETARAVSGGSIEAGLVVLPVAPTNLAVRPLLRDEVFLVSANKTHTDSPVTPNVLSKIPLILYDSQAGDNDPTRRQLNERTQLAGVAIDPIIEVEYVEGALRLVAEGIGDTIVCGAVAASSVFPEGLHLAPLVPRLFDTIALIQRRGHVLSPATRELVRVARDRILRGQVPPNDTHLDVWRPTVTPG